VGEGQRAIGWCGAAAKPEARADVPRARHDLRVTAITNDALAGANPIAIMTKAGHANMATTKVYLKLAGIVFREEAEQLERRLLGVSTRPSTYLTAPKGSSGAAIRPEKATSAQAVA